MLFGVACSAESESIATTEQAVLGDALPGTPADLLAEARDAFAATEGIGDGVGPIFNGNACGQCHGNGALGGAGEQIERRFGQVVNGAFQPLDLQGGSLRQLFTVGNFNNPDLPAASRGRCQPGNPTLCCVPQEVDPPNATVRNVGRRAQPLFGLGLVDTLADSVFDQIAASQPAAIRGTVLRTAVLIPNPGDPSQNTTVQRVARFGWKGGVPTLLTFSADAYVNEMAITTQSCFRGQSLTAFGIESAPNGTPVVDGCDDLAARQVGPVPSPTAPGHPVLTATQWAQNDDAVGSCAGNRTEIQDDVFLFAVFMMTLAPPPRDTSLNPTLVNQGQTVFTQIGCNGCHRTQPYVSRETRLDIGNGEEVAVIPGGISFTPYSDFITHDMGSLGDGIGNAGDNAVAARRMRTQPLWGLRFQNKLLHDGRVGGRDVAGAVRAHDGQGAAARNAYNALSSANQHALNTFVLSL